MYRHTNRSEQEVLSLVNNYEAVSQNGVPKRFNEDEYINLSTYYSDNSDFQRAHQVLEDALTYYPYSTTFLICKSQILIEEGKREDALLTISQAEIYSPLDFNILLLKADILNQMGQGKQALLLLNKASTENEENLSELYLFKATIHEKLKDLDKMFEATKMSLLIDHKNIEALEHIWWCVELNGNYDESINLHKEIISKDPYSYLAWYNLGYAFFNKGNYEEASNAMEYSYLINKDFNEAYKMAAESYINLREIDKAMDCYTDLIARVQPDSELYTKIAYCYELQGKDEDAKKHYLTATRMNNKDHLAYFHLAEFYKKKKDFRKAIAAYLKAIQIDDGNELYYFGLADTYVNTEEFEKAIPFFRQAADIAADVPDYWIDFACFYADREEYQKAYNVLSEALECTTGHEILYAKAACLYLMERPDEAGQYLRKALASNPKESSLFFDFAPELELDNRINLIISYFEGN